MKTEAAAIDPPRRIRVLLADDEAMIRSALAALLRLEPDIDVIAECSDGEQAVAAAEKLHPDVCLLDLEMPGLDGVEVAERLRRTVTARCIVVTRHARPGVLRRALAAGVAGFLPKSRDAREVAEVIRRVAAGARYVDPEIAADALSDERCPLTDRELDVLRSGVAERRRPRSPASSRSLPAQCAITCRPSSPSSRSRPGSRRCSWRRSAGGSDAERLIAPPHSERRVECNGNARGRSFLHA